MKIYYSFGMNVLHKNLCDLREGRWCIYSHYNKAGSIDLYVIDAVRSLRDAGFCILFVSTSPVENSECLTRLKLYVSILAVRENIGYDFGSYKLGIQLIVNHRFPLLQLLLTNDSVFGPFFDLSPFLVKAGQCDIFGMTESFELGYHLQSYFILYNRKVLRSPAFAAFWESVKLLEDGDSGCKREVVERYEVGGSQYFLRHGFSLKAAFPQALLLPDIARVRDKDQFFLMPLELLVHLVPGYPRNPTHFYWRELIALGYPYLKRDLLASNPSYVDIWDWPSRLSSCTQYDVKMILLSLYNAFGNDDFMYLLRPSWELAWGAAESGNGSAKLEICQELKNWSFLFNTPDIREFSISIRRPAPLPC